jgi:hypothetical protein
MHSHRRRHDPRIGSLERKQRRRYGLDLKYAAHTRWQVCRDLERAGLISTDPAVADEPPRESMHRGKRLHWEWQSSSNGAERLWQPSDSFPLRRPKIGDRGRLERDRNGKPVFETLGDSAIYVGFRNGADPEPGWHSGPYWPETRGDEPLPPVDALDPWLAETFEQLLLEWGAPVDVAYGVYEQAAELGGHLVEGVPSGYDSVRTAPPCPQCGRPLLLPREEGVRLSCGGRSGCGWQSELAGDEFRNFRCGRCGALVNVKNVLQHKCKEERSVTAVEQRAVIERIDRMEARLAEALNTIQWTVGILAGRYDEKEVRSAAAPLLSMAPNLREAA